MTSLIGNYSRGWFCSWNFLWRKTCWKL